VTSHKHAALDKCLDELQVCMQAAGLWSEEVPSEQALNSSEPFCVDTLGFEQWLQFIMVVRFKEMIQKSIPLPTHCDMSSMAQEAFKVPAQPKVAAAIKAIDKLLSGL